MKKTILTLICGVCLLGGAYAQGYNLFDAQDVDANGWLWFDTQAKIDKYVGQANNTTGTYLAGGKIIQLVSTGYTVSVPDPNGFPGDVINVPVQTFVGPDTVGASNVSPYEIKGPDAKTGAIVLTRASPSGKDNGGGILIKLPPIVSYELYLSGEVKMLTNTRLTATETARFGDYQQVKGYSLFLALNPTGGHKTWNVGNEKNANTGVAVTTPTATQYVLSRNVQSNPLYIHGIRIFTKDPTSTGVNNVQGNAFNIYYNGSAVMCNSEQAALNVFDVAGKNVASGKGTTLELPGIKAGVYIVKATEGSKTQTAKIVVR